MPAKQASQIIAGTLSLTADCAPSFDPYVLAKKSMALCHASVIQRTSYP
jgi:hypothetical protein